MELHCVDREAARPLKGGHEGAALQVHVGGEGGERRRQPLRGNAVAVPVGGDVRAEVPAQRVARAAEEARGGGGGGKVEGHGEVVEEEVAQHIRPPRRDARHRLQAQARAPQRNHLAARPCLLHQAVEERCGGKVGGGRLKRLCGAPGEEHSVHPLKEPLHHTRGGVVRDGYHSGPRRLQPPHIAGLDVGALWPHSFFGHADRPQARVMFAFPALPHDGVCGLGRVGQDADDRRGGRVA
mmetsp:Transcript_3798/g.7834  ORF Transcript_3798/g.7834 Transcript_3798/m.7834 type:complete len:239 (+) Transcript_3798:402-1118(+)